MKNKNAAKLGKLGGLAVKEKYGRDYFKQLIKKRWDKKEPPS